MSKIVWDLETCGPFNKAFTSQELSLVTKLLTYKTKIVTVRWIASDIANDSEKRISQHEQEKIFETRPAALRFGKKLLRNLQCWGDVVEIEVDTRCPYEVSWPRTNWNKKVYDLTLEGLSKPWNQGPHSVSQAKGLDNGKPRF